MEKFILCDDEKILSAGIFNEPEEIIDKCERSMVLVLFLMLKKKL